MGQVTARTKVLPFRAPARRRLHEDVAEQLRDAIFDGRFQPGEKLPPERELAEQFQVNRTSVREAIKVLEGQSLVSVRHGDGVTVQPLVDATLDSLGPMIFHGGRLDAELVHQLAEVVLPLLFEMARLAIARYRPAELARFVLSQSPGAWTPDRIRTAMNGTLTLTAEVMPPLPVLIYYTTAIVRADGNVEFFEDIYGLDRALDRILGKGRRTALALPAPSDRPR